MNSIKVALIEDDPFIAKIYLTRFELTGGYSVRVADNGSDGLVLVSEFKPDVILLDMMMPKMSGIDTLAALRGQPGGEEYRIIALTNMNDVDTLKKVKELGVEDYIVKAESSPGKIEQRVRQLASTEDAIQTPANK